MFNREMTRGVSEMRSRGRIYRTWQGREREKCKAAQRSLTWAADYH